MKTVNVREYWRALKEVRAELRAQAGGCNIELCELNNDEQPILLGVNWAAIGTVDANTARDFATAIANAAALAENFIYTGYTVIYC